MLEALDQYEADEISLTTLTWQLKGLMGASDLHGDELRDGFWLHFAPIDGELELRTESWAPAGSASDEDLAEALTTFRLWVEHVLATTSDERV